MFSGALIFWWISKEKLDVQKHITTARMKSLESIWQTSTKFEHGDNSTHKQKPWDLNQKYYKCSTWRIWQYLQHPEANQTRPQWHVISRSTHFWHSAPNGICWFRFSRAKKVACNYGSRFTPLGLRFKEVKGPTFSGGPHQQKKGGNLWG